VDSHFRRQEELKSKLFGRETPAAGAAPWTARGTRLTPNDFKWHSIPEQRGAQAAPGELSHADRAYREKCSDVFGRRSPEVQQAWGEAQRQQQQEYDSADAKRRANVYYSDLFGRAAEGTDVESGEVYRPRTRGSEEQIIVHQDWSDAKTELMHARESRAEHPHQRKSQELHSTRCFGGDRGNAWERNDPLDPVTYDNSDKLRQARGRGTQQIHQAHLRTSMTSPAFYEEAEGAKHWEVAELHVSGLGKHANDESVRDLCQGFDLQLVKVAAEVDPVRNLCKGRAKVVVRYNPKREGVEGLVRKFESRE